MTLRTRREPSSALPIAEIVERTAPVGGRAALELRLAASWAAMVGPVVAKRSRPVSLTRPRRKPSPSDPDVPEPTAAGGTLTVLVEGAFALEMQHLAPLVIERIAGLLGPGIVGRIAIKQGRIEAPQAETRPGPDPESLERARKRVEGVGDAGLREALARLGAGLRGRGERSD